MIKFIGVDPDRVFGLQKDYGEKAQNAMKNNDEQFFDAFEAFLKSSYEQKAALIREVLKRDVTPSFVVGQIFQYLTDVTGSDLSDDFDNWLWKPSQEKVITIKDFEKSDLRVRFLDESMHSKEAKITFNPILMEENTFWALFFLLFIKPKLGKKVLKCEIMNGGTSVFQVKLDSGMEVDITVCYYNNRLQLNAFKLGQGYFSKNWRILFLQQKL